MSALAVVLLGLEVALSGFFYFWAQGDARGFSFATPAVLFLLAPILAHAILQLSGRRSPMLAFSYTSMTAGLPQSMAEAARPAVLFLGSLGLCFIVLAAARPQAEGSTDKDFTEGIDIVFALDVSGSMEAADFKPNNRLFVAKEMLAEVIQSRKSDRIGLVVFAGEAYTQVPLTLDYNVLVNLLGDIRTGVIRDGTAIGDALGTSVNRLRDERSKTRVVILLTDGDNNAGSLPPLEAAAIAADHGISIYTILIGREGPVPFPAGRDLFGNTVYNNVPVPTNPELLQQIAEKTKALSFRAEDRDALKRTLHDALDHLEKTKFEESASGVKHELFMPYLGFGLALLLLERLLRMWRFGDALEG